MQPESNSNPKSLGSWANQLACPACLGALQFQSDRVVCSSCGRIYPIEDGIPVLIIERATLSAV